MKFLLPLLSFVLVHTSISAQNIIANGAKLTLVADSFEFTEGPAVDKNGDIYFTDQPNDRIVKWSHKNNKVSDWMKPSGRSNGLYFDNQGNLISCADEKNELWKIDAKKNVTVLIDSYKGKLLGGPNDLWIDGQGGIYITDPYYERSWWKHTKEQIKERRVYYYTPETQEIKIVADDFINPNGIIGSADGTVLYISDIGSKKTYRYTIQKDGSLSERSIFCEMGSDGMTIDNQGNVYLTGDGVTVFNEKGDKIQHIDVPEEWTANVTFGGPSQNILFITAMDAVYTLKMAVNGVR